MIDYRKFSRPWKKSTLIDNTQVNPESEQRPILCSLDNCKKFCLL